MERYELQGNRLLVMRGQRGHDIPLELIASVSELLGIADPVTAVEAIVESNLKGEPPVDPVTGENAWTESYVVLSRREQAREDEAFRAIEEGSANDPRSPMLRSMLAARESIGAQNKETCMLRRCRENTRKRLDIGVSCAGENETNATKVLTQEEIGKEKVSTLEELVRSRADFMNECKVKFLHSLTDHVDNPLHEAPPVEVPREVTQSDILERYS